MSEPFEAQDKLKLRPPKIGEPASESGRYICVLTFPSAFASRVRWRWPFDLKSGGKTAALQITLASRGVCTRLRRRGGTRGGRCRNREERPGTGFARRDFRLGSIFHFALAEWSGRLCRLGRWTWLRHGRRSLASNGCRRVGRRGALCRRRNRGC